MTSEWKLNVTTGSEIIGMTKAELKHKKGKQTLYFPIYGVGA